MELAAMQFAAIQELRSYTHLLPEGFVDPESNQSSSDQVSRAFAGLARQIESLDKTAVTWKE